MPDVENFRFFHICHGKAFEISPHVEKMLISRPMVKYAYLRASNARASFVNVPEKISGKNAHLARASWVNDARICGTNFFVGNDTRASFVKVPEKIWVKNAY